MTDEERKNRNPAPEMGTFDVDECPEVFIKDLEVGRVYILQGKRAVTLNYMGSFDVGVIAYVFAGMRAELVVSLCERPDKSGTLEDGRGVKVTIRKYTGPDA